MSIVVRRQKMKRRSGTGETCRSEQLAMCRLVMMVMRCRVQVAIRRSAPTRMRRHRRQTTRRQEQLATGSPRHDRRCPFLETNPSMHHRVELQAFAKGMQ